MDKKELERIAKSRQEDAILNRVLLWFGAAVVFELFLLLVNRFYLNYRVSEIGLAQALYHIVGALVYIGLAGAAAGVVWMLVRRKSRHRALPVALTVLSAMTSLGCFLLQRFGAASIQVLQFLTPAVAVLALVYYLYQHDFFVATVLNGLCIFGLWLYRRSGSGHPAVWRAYLAAFAVILIAAAAAAKVLQSREGMMKLLGKDRRLLPHGAAYPMLYLTCALTALAMIAAVAFGATAAYYAIFVVVAWIFVMAVYYTVRLM